MSSTSSHPHADMRRRSHTQWSRRSHLMPFAVTGGVCLTAILLVAYLLWPTWDTGKPSDPSHLPMLIGNVPFNVPTKAIRVKLQKRTGPQERVDLNFVYPSLDAPEARPHITADAADESRPEIDRIFLSITAHHDALAPDERVRTIYPRYLDSNPARVTGGLSLRPFRDNTPYTSEDLVYSSTPQFIARCSRDGATPGMCLSERRIDGADLTFRFPRSWLAQWRGVTSAMDQLVSRMRKSRN